MEWDGVQREMLAALGHPVYALAATVTPAAAGDAPPLLLAIARAAGVEVSALPSLPALGQLRAPGAKRALWPQLRAMRRARAERARR